MLEIHQIFIIGATLLLLGVFGSKLSDWLNFPALLIFLGIGMLAGSEGIGGIHFDNAVTANTIGTVALAFILFSGGLDTNWKGIRPILRQGILLSTVGVALTALLVGVFACVVLGFSLREGLLLGAIVSSTDAAAVFAILRSRRTGLKNNLQPLLEFESGSNDPMAVFLTLSMIGFLKNNDASLWMLLPDFFMRMSIGAVTGIVAGKAACWLFNRLKLDFEGLYPVLGICIVLLVFGGSETLNGNGFLAVYTCAIVMGNSPFLYKRSVMKFHDGFGWLMQIIIFLTLGLLVFPSRLPPVAFNGLLVSVFLMLMARPAAVFLTMIGSGFTVREKIFVSWAGLRGAVPIVLATFPLMSGYDKSDMMFNIVFFIVLTSVLLQGKTLMPLARLLKLDKLSAGRLKYPLDCERTGSLDCETREVEIMPDSSIGGKCIAQIPLPSDVMILLVRRNEKFLIPKGKTVIEPGDNLLIFATPVQLQAAEEVLNAPVVTE
ncbi:MAG: potassium/proton antiporter [Victivallaceae bacterium]